jgi:bacteriocin biosynthesis cyclodehydratase domain-containing protein
VGELWLIDGDRVEESNLNRQIQYAEADIGRLKVEATAERLQAFNSRVKVRTTAERVESQSQLGDLIAGADLVVDAADWPAHEIELWCNGACFEAGIPYIAMSHYPPVARAGPLYVPGQTGCFACQAIAFRRDYPLYDIAIEQRKAKPSPAATLGPACGLVGGLVGAEVMHFLTQLIPPSMLGAGYIFDLRTMEVERFEVEPEPACPVCSHLQPGETG